MEYGEKTIFSAAVGERVGVEWRAGLGDMLGLTKMKVGFVGEVGCEKRKSDSEDSNYEKDTYKYVEFSFLHRWKEA